MTVLVCRQYRHIPPGLFLYFIFARTAALLSVFWKSALTSCFTCSAGNSSPSFPFPPPHLSSISLKVAPSIKISSLNLPHLLTNLPGSSDGKREGALATSWPSRETSWPPASAEMSSKLVIIWISSSSTVLRRVPWHLRYTVPGNTFPQTFCRWPKVWRTCLTPCSAPLDNLLSVARAGKPAVLRICFSWSL